MRYATLGERESLNAREIIPPIEGAPGTTSSREFFIDQIHPIAMRPMKSDDPTLKTRWPRGEKPLLLRRL